MATTSIIACTWTSEMSIKSSTIESEFCYCELKFTLVSTEASYIVSVPTVVFYCKRSLIGQSI